jgi:hypothetical protein
MRPRAALRRLEELRLAVGVDAADEQAELLSELRRARFVTARDVLRAHEAACFARAYPGHDGVLHAATRLLDDFERRADLKRHAEALADSGIAGTRIRYRFFWPMARWLATTYPDRLAVDWTEAEFEDRLAAALVHLLPAAPSEAAKRGEWKARKTLDAFRGQKSDAVYLLELIASAPGDDRSREAMHDAIDIAYVLLAGVGGPSRTRARFDGAPFALRTQPFERGRPGIAKELRRKPRSVTKLSATEGMRILDLAREAMVTRSRDLDAFAHGDAREVRMIDDGDGLAFALIGVVPERRLFLPAVYGALTLRSGIPVGYVQLDILFRNAEVSYNTFPTFRGAEAGFLFARLLAATHHVFGVSSFSVEPYQLGRGNDEGIASGAWWFYAGFGFRPKDEAAAKLAASELKRKARKPLHLSSETTLKQLAASHVHWPEVRRGVTLVTPIERIGQAVGHHLAAEGADACDRGAAAKLGIRSTQRWNADERLWWKNWAPMLDAIPNLDRWSAKERAEVVAVVRAKGGASELAYSRKFDRHPKLARAIARLAT